MRTIISRWFLFGLLFGWALTHATVFGQSTSKGDPQPNKLRAGLDKAITVDFNGATMEAVVKHICEKAGLPVEFDPNFPPQMPIGFNGPGNDPQFQIKAKDEKASQVLRRFLKAYHFTYVQCDGVILVTSEELAVHRQYQQRVSVDVDDVPLKKAVRELAKSHGINLVIDPILGNDAEKKVTLQLEDTGLETALRLLAEMASLKAVRMGNVMFVTNEKKAKDIRKEERQLNDNSNVPPTYYPPPGVVQGFALPGRAAPALPPQAAPVPLPNNGLLPAPPPVIQRQGLDGTAPPNSIPRVIRN
jgi:type II secretory pathway component GspD/PulD (secretin)